MPTLPVLDGLSEGGHMLNIMLPMVTVFVHPVDTTIHPTYAPGYRWSVIVGGKSVDELDYCVGAGHEELLQLALLRGEEVGAAAALTLRHFGVEAECLVHVLKWDPIPRAADDRPLLRFGESRSA